MADDFADVEIFVMVVEAGGFSAAARIVNLSRSAVGKAISRLELRLGSRLFHRTTRSQNLTEDGKLYYEHCHRAIDELKTAKALLESGRRSARGRLRVTMPVLFGRLCIAPVLTHLASAHPDLELDLNFTDRPVDLIEDGFDLAIRNGAIGTGAGLMVRRIAHEETSVFAAPTYLSLKGVPATPADLKDHHAVTYSRAGREQRWMLPVPDASIDEIVPRTRMRFDDLDAIADATAAGLGLAWLPSWLIRKRISSGALVRVFPEISPYVTDVHAIWPETPYLPMRTRVAIDALADEVGKLSSSPSEPPTIEYVDR